jgi:hypothetical protein
MAERELRNVSTKNWFTQDGKGAPNDPEIQSGSQQRMADALERSAVAHERMAKSGERTVALHELHLKPKAELEEMNRKFRESNILLQDELKKAYRERDEFKNKVNIQRDGVRHLYHVIGGLRARISWLTNKAR